MSSPKEETELEKLKKENQELKLLLSQKQTTSTTTSESIKDVYPTTRYNGPPIETLTSEQIAIRNSILATRKGTGLSGPFGPWLANPSLANHAQLLGKFCRYDTSLSKWISYNTASES